jgi:hypothetical protein
MEEELSMHRLCRSIALAAVAAALVLAASSSTARAQDNVYSLSYYSNAHTAGPDATLRLVNDGNVSDSSPAGDLWASLYIFDDGEQLAECCSCRVTPNGYLALSVNALTSNPLTPKTLRRGVIKVLSTNNGSPQAPSLHIGIRGWLTHIQNGTGTSFAQTEEELTDSTLGAGEFADLGEDCGVLIELGSGFGQCFTACAGVPSPR